MKKELIAFKDPKSPISEVFRTLRTNIQFMNTKKQAKTILITSTFAGEGKSWVSSNLAVTFAQAGKKVLLIDSDMRKGRQYSIFGISPKPGLSNYLGNVNVESDGSLSDDISEYIQSTDVENLYVMPAGSVPPNPSELLNSAEMAQSLEKLKKSCDIIIIDGTPSQLVTDSLILARLVDSTVIVSACKETKREDLNRVITNLKNIGADISGIVLNKVPVSSKKYEEKYYYTSTSSEYKKKSATGKVSNVAKNKPLNDFNYKKLSNDLEKIPSKNVNSSPDISIDKTKDILSQINEYLDNEKKKLK